MGASEQGEPDERPDTAVARNGEPAPPEPPTGADPAGLRELSEPATAQHVKVLADYDIPEFAERTLETVLDPDFMLSNLTAAEVHELKYELKTSLEITLASFPPEESALQGEIRKEFGFGEAKTALSPSQRDELINAFRAAWTRIARSRKGWQQELLAEQTQVRRVEDEREDDPGTLEKLLGG